ncbi:CubicO group peptidase, beta-lactamase class C family [Paracoccus isoporae]|uniref:CubicO group peptidase, beta-lactamase class C family n=1 Tax=Paracoccus isoporae TaxID=591205 RepID=A0A1G6WR76_9RHOB|nr:serine hydrolase domain-containing protein [Paracoccus isoporae]SDD68289.1 CubicO group peptidase, beta-lactamase class C family [Paracoccus isoporae]
MMRAQQFDAAPVAAWLDRERQAGRLQAGALEIEVNGHRAHDVSFGHHGRDGTGAAITRDTAFWIASMTKPIVSVAALQLIESGQLSLAAQVRDHIPGFGDAGVLRDDGETDPLYWPVTIADLMRHTSGLTYGAFGDQPIHRRYRDANAFDFTADNREIAIRLRGLPLLHQPGTVFEYGMSTDLLGRVIEVITGDPLDTALQRMVLGPLGMTRTGFLPDPAGRAALPSSPVQQSFAPPLSAGQKWWSGGAGLWSSVADYMRFARMLHAGGALDGVRILDPETVALMRQNHLPPEVAYGEYTETLGITAPWPENGLGFGLGLAVRTRKTAEIPGGVGEFFWPGISGANFWVDPAHELIVVFLTHAPEHRADHRIGLRRAVYDGLGTI